MSDLLNSIAAEFDDHPARSVWLEVAGQRVNSTAFGAQTTLAASLMAAHWMALADGSSTGGPAEASGAGPVTSMKEGDVSISFASLAGKAATMGDATWSETKWGRMYLALRASRACGHARVVVPG